MVNFRIKFNSNAVKEKKERINDLFFRKKKILLFSEGATKKKERVPFQKKRMEAHAKKKHKIGFNITLTTLRIGAFRSAISSRLNYSSKQGVSPDLIFPYKSWSMGDEFEEDQKRASNMLYVIFVINLAVTELETVSSIYDHKLVFTDEYKSMMNDLHKIRVSRDYTDSLGRILKGEMTVSEIEAMNIEQFMSDAEGAVESQIRLLTSLLRTLDSVLRGAKIESFDMQQLLSNYLVNDEVLDTTAYHYISLMNGATKDMESSMDLEQDKEPVMDSWSAALGVSQEHLSSVLLWVMNKMERLSTLDIVIEGVLSREVFQGPYVMSTLKQKDMKKRLSEYASFDSASWVVSSSKGKFVMLPYVAIVVNFMLQCAIEIIFPGMKILREFSEKCSSEIEISVNRILSLRMEKTESGIKILDQEDNRVSIIDEAKSCYSLIARACHIVTIVWHFEKVNTRVKEPKWQKEGDAASAAYIESLDSVDYPVVRSGIKYRIKRSNIQEAGLGIFFDEDLDASPVDKVQEKLKDGKYGLPILVYDGELMSEAQILSFYGVGDSLRPYSVATSAEKDKDLDAYHGVRHDVARFINDCFNRLPEVGTNADPLNKDPSKRTFRYNTYFMWTNNGNYASNDDIIKHVRRVKEKEEDKASMLKEGYSLVVYTIPRDNIADTDPDKLFKKGQELWLSYGYDYIRRISAYERLNSLELKLEDRAGFIGSKRNQFDVTMQENVGLFLFTVDSGIQSQKETYKELISRMVTVNNIMGMRPYNDRNSYLSHALEELADLVTRKISVEADLWLTRYMNPTSSSAVHYLGLMLRSRIFNQKKIHRDLNVLDGDIPMDSLISVLLNAALFYSSCITLHLALRSGTDFTESHMEFEEECGTADTEVSISSKRSARVTSEIVEKHKNKEKVVEMLVTYCISWHVKSEAMFDAASWISVFKMLRRDLDWFVKSLSLDGFSFESYAMTKQLIQKKEMSKTNKGRVRSLALNMFTAVQSEKTSDYLPSVTWMNDEDKIRPEIQSLCEQLFTQDTVDFRAKCLARFQDTVRAMEGSELSKRIFRFDQIQAIPDVLNSKQTTAILTTVWAYANLDQVLPKAPSWIKEPSKLITMIRDNRYLFWPPWVYEGTKADMLIDKLSTQFSSEKYPRGTKGPYIEITYQLELDLKLGKRHSNDEYPRSGYCVEGFVSRELGPNFSMTKQELTLEGNSVKKQKIRHRFELIKLEDRQGVRDGDETDPSVFLPLRADPLYCSIGVYIKGLVRPRDGARVIQGSMRYDYDGECYIPFARKDLVGSSYPILCKTFEMDRDYRTVGRLTVLDFQMELLDLHISGEFSEGRFKSLERMSEALIDKFFDDITTKDVGYRHSEPFLRNKHTPIWPNTPLSKLPSSLYTLNVPMGEHAINGIKTFMRALHMVCTGHGINPNAELHQSFRSVFRVRGSTPTGMDTVELFAVVRLIGEALTMIAVLSDYRPDYTPDGKIGENISSGTDAMNDCEDDGGLSYIQIKAIAQVSFEESNTMYYVQKLLDCYVKGLLGCSSSKKAMKDMMNEDPDLGKEYRGKMHINHVLGGMIPFEEFYQGCLATGKYPESQMEDYRVARKKEAHWFDLILPAVINEGTGFTANIMVTCETLIEDTLVKSGYQQWAKKFVSNHVEIFSQFDGLSTMAFQDNSALRYVGYSESSVDKINFSNFYTKMVHFWTDDMAMNGGPLTTDFLFCYKGSKKGESTPWVYGVSFIDYIKKSKDVHMYPLVTFTETQFKDLAPVAAGMVYPPKFPSVPTTDKRLIEAFGRPESEKTSVLESWSGSKVSGIMSQSKIFAYLNHRELYDQKKREEIQQLISSGRTSIVGCRVYECMINEIVEMIQFVFYLG
jgi:hypothetical protein